MDTKEQLTILSEICRQDIKIVNNREKLNRLNLESKQAKDAARELEDTMATLNQSKVELLKRRKLLDEKLHLEKANLRKWESRAEKIKGEREYTALMSEIGAQKRTLLGIETEINEVLDELKASEDKLKKASSDHGEKTESAKRAYESVKELFEEEQSQLESNQIARESLLDKLPKPLKVKYDRIYERRGQMGIASLREGICQACMRLIPPELFIRVCKGEIIEQCPSCQRLLLADMNLAKDGQ
jgi:uncharacterized protein